MKLVVVAVDGSRAFRCAAVQNPTLFARDLATQTGSAIVLFAGAPLLDASAYALVDELDRFVLPRFVAGPALQHDPFFIASVAWTVSGRPLLAAMTAHTRRSVCRKTGVTWLKRLARNGLFDVPTSSAGRTPDVAPEKLREVRHG